MKKNTLRNDAMSLRNGNIPSDLNPYINDKDILLIVYSQFMYIICMLPPSAVVFILFSTNL